MNAMDDANPHRGGRHLVIHLLDTPGDPHDEFFIDEMIVLEEFHFPQQRLVRYYLRSGQDRGQSN